MSLLTRTLLIWALVLALPAQGAAAVTMAFCGSAHHSGVVAALTAAAPADHAHHDGAGPSKHEHHQAAAVVVDDTIASTDGAEAADKTPGGPAIKHSCSACAMCCSGGAIPSSVLAQPAPLFAPTVFWTVDTSVAPFTTDGPDRPPRNVLA